MLESEIKVIDNIQSVSITPSTPSYTKVFTSFGGADIVIYLDKVPLGEAQEIKWEKDLTGGRTWPIKGELICTLFDEEPIAVEDKDYYIRIEYANEYDQAMVEEFGGVRFHRMRGGASIDQIVSEVSYEFTASRRTLLPNLTWEELKNDRAEKFKETIEE